MVKRKVVEVDGLEEGRGSGGLVEEVARVEQGVEATDELLLEIKTLVKRLKTRPRDTTLLKQLTGYADPQYLHNAKAVRMALRSSRMAMAETISCGHHTERGDDKGADRARELRAVQREFQDSCVAMLEANDPSVQKCAVETSMQWMRDLSRLTDDSHGSTRFPAIMFRKFVERFINSEHVLSSTRELWLRQYLDLYIDLKTYFFRETAKALEQIKVSTGVLESEKAGRVLDLMLGVSMDDIKDMSLTHWLDQKPLPEVLEEEAQTDSDDEDGHDDRAVPSSSKRANRKTVANAKSEFTKAWTTIMAFQLDIIHIRRILLDFHARILPFMGKPLLMSDFLSDAVSHGGSSAVLALNGLFTLMMKHKLDYPDFYQKLYGLITPALLHTPFRSRFFRLLDVFLGSSHLPVNLVASFVKRLSRRSLAAPPGAIVLIVPFIYNMLKRHPQCMALLHRPSRDLSTTSDPFDDGQDDPIKTNASESSLWELVALAQTTTAQATMGTVRPSPGHYLYTVSALARVMLEPFSKAEYNLEDFLDHSTASIFETELGRLDRIWNPAKDGKRKQVSSSAAVLAVKEPALALDRPTSLFGGGSSSAFRHWQIGVQSTA